MTAQAQRIEPRGGVRGTVLAAGDAVPIAGATVVLSTRTTVSDSSGHFVLTNVAPGHYELRVEHPRFATRLLPIRVAVGDTVRIFVRLATRFAELERVTVTAREVRGAEPGSSASVIGRDAIEHVQASSLADVLQLVPGQPAVNPSLAGVRQSLLRQAPLSGGRDPGPGSEADRANALGTAIVLDGVPLSNNANIQTTLTILNSAPGALPSFASAADRGLDLRQLPADNVESVEVVRGVMSARHGDLTTGAILVTTRTGARAPELRLRANPQTFEMSGVAGWGAARGSGLSLDGNLTRSQDDPRTAAGRFTRLTGNAAWRRPWGTDGRVQTVARLRLFGVIDEQQRDPGDRRYQIERWSRDRGGRVEVLGTWRRDSAGPVTLEVTGSAQLAEQGAFTQELISRDIFPVSRATRDTTAPAVFGRSEYLSRLRVDGRPLNAYARVEWRGVGALGSGWSHQPIAGAEWRRDANLGRGRRFDPITPPRQNYSVGDRPRDFRGIPALDIASAYVEERVRGTLAGRGVALDAGMRFDNVAPIALARGRFGTVLAPRLRARLELAPALHLRVGHGVTAKAPTLAQLHPGPRFFDLASFNYYAERPDERLSVVTTRVVEPSNEGMRAYRMTKTEGGADWRWKRADGTLTAFREVTRGAFGTTRYAVPLVYPRLRAVAFPAGAPPVLDVVPAAIDTFLAAYDAPRNSRAIVSSGVEFTAEIPEWQLLRTSVSLGGAAVRSLARDTDQEVAVDRLFAGTVQPALLGVYDAGRGSEGRQFLTSVRAVHRAPAVGMVASVLVQTTWWDDDRPVGRDAALPVAVVDRRGVLTPLTPAEAVRPEYAALVRPVSPQALAWERRPALWLVNVRLTKTLGRDAQFAFFVNNAFADRPLFASTRGGGLERRNPPLFFGVEALASLRAFSP